MADNQIQILEGLNDCGNCDKRRVQQMRRQRAMSGLGASNGGWSPGAVFMGGLGVWLLYEVWKNRKG